MEEGTFLCWWSVEEKTSYMAGQWKKGPFILVISGKMPCYIGSQGVVHTLFGTGPTLLTL